jgi:hypothetical protein
VAKKGNMRFDLFHELSMPPQLARTESQAVADWLDEVALADQLGFGCGWLVEHHFMRGYSHSSKPEILLAVAAARTQRLRLGLGVIPAQISGVRDIGGQVLLFAILRPPMMRLTRE